VIENGEPSAPSAPVPLPRSGAGNVLEVIYGILFAPRAAFGRLSARPPLAFGLITAAVVSVLLLLANVRSLTAVLSELGAPQAGLLAGMLALALLPLAALGFLFTAATYDFTAQLLGGRGAAVGMTALLGLAELPRLALLPVAAFVDAVWVVALVAVGIAAWVAVLRVLAIMALYRIGAGRAVVTVVAVPVLVGMVAALIVGAFWGTIVSMVFLTYGS